MRVDGNYGSTKAYEPNSLDLWQEQLDTKEPELAIQGGAYSYDFREDDDDYFSQPRALFNLMTPEQKTVLFENTARSIGSASLEVQYRHIRNCHQADPAYAQGVADALKLKISDII